ncbi:MAG: GtrA family protein [Burkholderiaceae bacterium]
MIGRSAVPAIAPMSSLQPTRSLFWFVAVGGMAAAVHWTVVVALVELRAWPPLLANGAGWLVAFMVSFAGHHRLTFRGHGRAPLGSAARFWVVSLAGFIINEATYGVLLGFGGLQYQWALSWVLLLVAFATWWLSRSWAFARSR